jgi:hypothetical protein
MNKNHKRKLAELSLIYGVPIVTNAKENSRLAGLQRKLQKIIIPDLMSLPTVSEKDVKYIDDHIEAWLKEVGWWHNPTKVGLLISFCMDVIEESTIEYNPTILDTLQKIGEHLFDGNNFDYFTMAERNQLLTTWEKVYG